MNRAEAADIRRAPTWHLEPVHFWQEAWAIPRLEIYERVSSTSDVARGLAEEGWGPYTTVISDEQTKGRGRSGAGWVSAPGAGLWMSVLLPATPHAHLPLVVGLAVAEAIEQICPTLDVRVEWPNDLTVADRKVAGVLCEGVRDRVVAGIGINTTAPPGGFPPDLRERATSLENAGECRADRSHLAGAVLTNLRWHVDRVRSSLARAELAALGRRDALAGREVVSSRHGRGLAVEIAADGSLILERENGERVRVRSGHVRPL